MRFNLMPLICLWLCVSVPLLGLVADDAGSSTAVSLEGVIDHLGFALLGSAIVFTTLIGLWAICWLVGRAFAEHRPSHSAPSSSAIADADPALIAVVSAAVAASLDRPHSIVSVRPREERDPRS